MHIYNHYCHRQVKQLVPQNDMLLWRLQKVTIEDVKDEESDLTPTPMINGVSENKISRDNSFSSNKYSDKTSIKVIKTLIGLDQYKSTRKSYCI